MTDDDDTVLRPAWRRAEPAESQPEPDEDSDALDRGRTVALLAAIGRMQMSLDVIARQQKQHQEAVDTRLARIERALGERS
jgi:hypothetical protein